MNRNNFDHLSFVESKRGPSCMVEHQLEELQAPINKQNTNTCRRWIKDEIVQKVRLALSFKYSQINETELIEATSYQDVGNSNYEVLNDF